MADGEDQIPSSPPLPKRGAYNIDFDALDETSNPFAPKVRLSSSPTNRSGIAASEFGGADDEVDPFKPKTKLASSPPGSPKVVKSFNNNNNIGDNSLHAVSENSVEGSDSPNPLSLGSTDEIPSAEVKQSTQVIAKKKKIVKKKVQSKIKVPKSVKSEEDGKEDSLVTALNESISTGAPEVVETESSPTPKKQILPRKKTKSRDLDGSTEKGDIFNQSKVEQPELEEGKVIKDVHVEDVPCESASEAMASSSEIDHHFVEHGDTEDPKHGKDKARLETRASNGSSELIAIDKVSGGGKSKMVEQVNDHTQLSKSDIVAKSPKETSSKHSSSPEGTKLNRSGDDLPIVNTPPQGKPVEGNSSKHPAIRALETAQADNSLKVLDSKNESSSEEAPFYDAYEYHPVATTKAKLGQKPSTEMDRGPNHEDGGDSKGAVVQLVQVLRYSQSDWNKLKQDMELNFQASLLNKERDWSLMLAERDKKISSLEETNRKVKHTNEDMRMIVAEFEKTISQLQAEKEKSKTDSHKTVQNLESERDQAIEDLQSVETAFSDLHRRYEKSKSIIEGFKRNEEQLKQCVEDLQNKLKKSDLKLQALRSQAEEKLDKANEDIEKIKKSTKSDIVRLEASVKKAELRISGLEESLQRKEKENQELTAICDELIAKVGS